MLGLVIHNTYGKHRYTMSLCSSFAFSKMAMVVTNTHSYNLASSHKMNGLYLSCTLLSSIKVA